jgi:stage II sporulation protein D
MYRTIVVILLSVFIRFFAIAQEKNLDICIYYNKDVTTVVFTPVMSYYLFTGNDTVQYRLDNRSLIYLSASEGMVSVHNGSKSLGRFTHVNITSENPNGYFRIKPVWPSLKSRSYDDDLAVTVHEGKLRMINRVAMNKYISGVVLAEGGPASEFEYYKAQALISRTYAVRHIDKHIHEGFNLCDRVHCQAYHGRNSVNSRIDNCVESTDHLVIVDKLKEVILSVYHSNSGGETANSEEVWSEALPYLRAKKDPYSLNQRNAKWTRKVKLSIWRDFLKSVGFSEKAVNKNVSFNMKKRKQYFCIGKECIEMRDIRDRFKLRSSFFSIKQRGTYVYFHGKGYGHGVGLSQIGAMNMARKGFSYEDIIKFYYNNVQLIPYEEVRKVEHKEDEFLFVTY